MRLTLLLCLLFHFGYGQRPYDKAYEKKFDQVRNYLGNAQMGPAFLLLQDLYKIDPKNHYTNYLMGVCYTESKVPSAKSIKHLEYATKNLLEEYGYIPYYEKRAPVFSWYYLTKAYSQNGMCAKARYAKNQFIEIYEKEKNGKDYFVQNVSKYLIDCKKNEAKIKNQKIKENLVTKEVDYTTTVPLWGVQVGSFNELVPIREEFANLKNVEAFLDKKGIVRYVVGHFQGKSQANRLLEEIKSLGYGDAFVVNVNKENRFSNEIIIVDNVSFKARMRGKIEFRVQLGAFKDSIPQYLAKVYIYLDELEETHEKDLTIVTAGHFDTYDAAAALKNDIAIRWGLTQSFITAYNQGHKVSLHSAMKYLQNEHLRREARSEKSDKKRKRK